MAATFVVEDGTGKTNANSYLSEADADSYFENHRYPLVWFGLTGATFSMDDTDNSLNDSASGFVNAGFAAGTRLKTSGFTEAANNATWTIVSVAAGKVVLKGGTVTTEAAGDTVTVVNDKEDALRQATAYLESQYNSRWCGDKASSTQALAWPRASIYIDGHYFSSSDLPACLEHATAEVALKVLEGETFLDDIEEAGSITREKVKVGDLEEDITYAGGRSQNATYPQIDALLREVIHAGSTLERA